MNSLMDSAILGATLVLSFSAAFIGQKIMLQILLKAIWDDQARELNRARH